MDQVISGQNELQFSQDNLDGKEKGDDGSEKGRKSSEKVIDVFKEAERSRQQIYSNLGKKCAFGGS